MLKVLVTNGAMSNNRTRSPSCRIHLPALGRPRTLKETPAAVAAAETTNCHTIQRMSGPRVVNVSSALKLVSLGTILCLMFWRPRSNIQPDNCELNPSFWCKCVWLLILHAAWLVSVTNVWAKFRILLIHELQLDVCGSEICLSNHSSLVTWLVGWLVGSFVRSFVACLITYFPQECGRW